MTGVWLSAAFLATAAYGWRMAILVWLLCGAIWLRRRCARELTIVMLVGAAAAVGAVRSSPPTTVDAPIWAGDAEGARGEIISQPTASGRGQSFRLAVTEVEIDDTWQPASGTICVFSRPFPITGVGDLIAFAGEPESLADESTAIQSYARHQGCGATVFARFLEIEQRGAGWRRWLADARTRIRDILHGSAFGDSGALLSGLVTGDDQALSDARQAAFLRTGTTHITAVSGANVALLVSILITLGTAGGWRRLLVWQLLVLLGIWGYAVLVGGEPPVIRAALVASAAMLAARVGRRPDFVTLIALAAMVMVLIEPAQVWSLSFQLSFAASLGIVLVLSGLANDGQLVGPAAMVWGTIAAQVATLPVLWYVFGELSLTTLPANLLIAPLILLAFPLPVLASVAGLVWLPLATVLVLPARLCAELVFIVVDWFGGSPRVTAHVGAASPFIALLTTAIAVVTLLGMSPDARRWFNRVSNRLTSASE
ncbi:MAG: ComEC/Rec2 family competence protein [Chloroflexota bacterium]|nr:ComEC/Rec2 family competence protein [Chloroflexota bacterium]